MSPVKTNSHSPRGRVNGEAAISAGALARRLAPSVPLTLELAQDDGPALVLTFRLAWDFNAVAAAEEATGLNMLRGDVWKDLTGSRLGILFWAALLAHQPEYADSGGLEVARSYIETSNVVTIGRAVEDAFLLSLPAAERESLRALRDDRPDGRPIGPTLNASAGSNSGQSPDTTSGLPTPNSVV